MRDASTNQINPAKMKLNYLACLGMLLIIFNACSKNGIENVAPEKPESEESVYLLLNKETIDFKVFKGSNSGGKDVSATEEPESFWNKDKLADLKYDTLIVRNDSIFERPAKYEKNAFKYKISNDTIYQWNRYASFWALYGLKKADRIEHYGSYYSFQKVSPPSVFAENGHRDGLVNSSKYFNDSEYMFKSPADMKSVNDQAAWYNIRYVYKKVNKTPG